MRVFTEEIRRWRLPAAMRPERVLSMTIAADGSSHLLFASFAGLHLLSYSSDGLTASHRSLGGRGSRGLPGEMRSDEIR